MSEWWSYRLGDFLLFAPRTYYRLIESTNRELWPAHTLALGVGIALLALTLRQGGRRSGRVVGVLLALAWLGTGGGFLLQRYATINWAARWFAAGFALEALFLLWTATLRGRLEPAASSRPFRLVGLGLVAFALLGMPLLEALLGRPWLRVECFGLFPDPTAVATLGVLLAARRLHPALLFLPLLWSGIGGATLLALHSPDAFLAPGAAAIALALVVAKALALRRAATPAAP